MKKSLLAIGTLFLITACGGGSSDSDGGDKNQPPPNTTPSEPNPNLAVVTARAAVITNTLIAELPNTGDDNLTGIWISSLGAIGHGSQASWDVHNFEILNFVDNGTSVTANSCLDPDSANSWTITYTEEGNLQLDEQIVGSVTDNHLINAVYESPNGSVYAETLVKLNVDIYATVGTLQTNDQYYEFDCSYFLKGSETTDTTIQQEYIVFRQVPSGQSFAVNPLENEGDSITIEGKTITVTAGTNTATLEFY